MEEEGNMKTGVEINLDSGVRTHTHAHTEEKQLSTAHHLLLSFQHMSVDVYIRTLPEQNCVEDAVIFFHSY